MKIIAFAGSNSKNSINKKLASFAAKQFKNAEVEILDLNDFELPLFSVDREKEMGRPQLAQDFLNKIASSDLLVVSLAENNGNYSAAFKNCIDWVSRINPKLFQKKPMLLMATSPGVRGGMSVLEIATNNFPRFDADIKATFSLPSFETNFNTEKGIINEELKNKLLLTINKIQDESI
jgi:NAD(P)H-dependent FMN reductase